MVVIEDDESAQALLGRYLEKLGYPAQFFPSADEALEGLEGEVPPLILLDRQLPGMDGIEFCRKYRSRPQSHFSYIIMMTASDEPARIEAALEAGANDYLVKPISFEGLRTRLVIAAQKIKEDENAGRRPNNPRLAADLSAAIDRSELEVHFQPIYGLRIGPFAEGMEALVRWNHPEQGMISPGRFIPIAEDNPRMIEALTRFVLDESVKTLRSVTNGRPDFYVSVNLSTVSFEGKDLVETVREILERHKLPPGQLLLEITETGAMRDMERAAALTHDLRALGVRVAIDDFGTGYSSLAYLQNFAFDVLKIDRSFTRQLPGNEHTLAITEAIRALAERLQIKTVVEGVETEEQFTALKGLGFRRFQGYYFARPVAGGHIDRLINRKSQA